METHARSLTLTSYAIKCIGLEDRNLNCKTRDLAHLAAWFYVLHPGKRNMYHFSKRNRVEFSRADCNAAKLLASAFASGNRCRITGFVRLRFVLGEIATCDRLPAPPLPSPLLPTRGKQLDRIRAETRSSLHARRVSKIPCAE